MVMGLADIGEFGLIERIGSCIFRPDAVRKAIGDDCAVLPFNATHEQIVTCDLLNEGVHFLRDKITPWQLGYKAVAVSLSDIAAMGGEAVSILVAIGVPADFTVEMWQGFYDGVKAICQKYRVNLIGGDTTKSQSGLVVNITALGVVAKPHLRLRSHAQVGDKVFVTGNIGDSRAGLALILHPRPPEDWHKPLYRAHLEPEPCLQEVRLLNTIFAEKLHALNDISDGLASECHEIAQASGVGMVLNAEAIPISSAAVRLAQQCGQNPLDWAFFGGEDYQLVGTVAADEAELLAEKYRALGHTLAFIGEVIDEGGVYLAEQNGRRPLAKGGYAHF